MVDGTADLDARHGGEPGPLSAARQPRRSGRLALRATGRRDRLSTGALLDAAIVRSPRKGHERVGLLRKLEAAFSSRCDVGGRFLL